MCDPEIGFEVTDPNIVMLLWKHKYWKAGIPCHQFRKDQKRDIIDVMDIENAINEKAGRVAKVNALMNKMRMGM